MTDEPIRFAGDPIPDKKAMIRVNHAGEYGAIRIYAGQLAVLGNRSAASGEIERMAGQEQLHLERFEKLLQKHKARPTALMPVWRHAGFMLGALSALAGPRTAMAVTAAVETEIDAHYREQLAQLGNEDPELSDTIETFRQEELEHRDTALDHGAEDIPAYPLLSRLVRFGCRAAIRLSEKI